MNRDQTPDTWTYTASAFRLDDDHWLMWADNHGWSTNKDISPRHFTAHDATGLMEWHWDAQRARWCGGRIGFTNRGCPDGQHQLLSTDPLHIEPSLLCNRCTAHGWIRDGRWIPA